jgi:shikimate dehydrogenase
VPARPQASPPKGDHRGVRGDPGGASPRGHTAAVLGSPIAHSLSPVLHTAAYAALGLDGWTYTAIECDEAGLPGLIASCDSQWAGLSLTMPLKRAVLPLLDRTEPRAAEVGGANTVVFVGGQRHGYNTDVPGMVAALAEAGVTAPARATILGAGATACAALAAVRETGLAAATVQVRDQARVGGLLAAARRLGLAVELRPFGSQVRDGDLLISTLPSGAADFYPERFGVDRPGPAAVLDVVYSPWPTPLALAAAKWGAIVVSGFDLLLHQAARQVELMTGIEPAPLEAMRAAGQSELARRALRRPLATPAGDVR